MILPLIAPLFTKFYDSLSVRARAGLGLGVS